MPAEIWPSSLNMTNFAEDDRRNLAIFAEHDQLSRR
jgi:hypothetical protein